MVNGARMSSVFFPEGLQEQAHHNCQKHPWVARLRDEIAALAKEVELWQVALGFGVVFDVGRFIAAPEAAAARS